MKRAKPSKKVSANPSGETVCPKCKGAGVLVYRNADGKPDYSRVVACECKKEELGKQKVALMLKYCELPIGTEKMLFENFKVDNVTKEAYQAAQKLASGDRLKWLTLTGAVDLGKTHLAVAICRYWMGRGVPARYAYVPLLLEELREGYRQEGDMSYQAKLRFFCNVPLLVLDDLGVEKSSDFAREKLNTIIDYRYNQCLPLVVTLNVPIDKIPGDSEHRIASRLQRFPEGRVVALEGEEYRLRKKCKTDKELR